MFFSIISGIWMFVSCFGAASKFVPILIGGGIGTIVSGVVSYYVFKGVAYCIEGFAASLELQMDTRDAVEKLVEDKVKEQ